MSSSTRKVSTGLIVIVLLAGLVGVWVIYMLLVSDLPARVYTSEQEEYLSYNYGRSIMQTAPIWNEVLPEGDVVPAVLTGWQSQVQATLEARYEEQEGVSVTLYDLDFQSEYDFIYPGPAVTTTVVLNFPFPGNLETLHNVTFLVDGEEPDDASYTVNGITWATTLHAGESYNVAIGYRADGANSFSYGLERDRRSDIDISLAVLGLSGSEVPKSSLPASGVEDTVDGETFAWEYAGLIPSRDIQLTLPRKLSFAQRVAQLQDEFSALAVLAPFLVGGFLLSLAGLFRLKGLRLSLVEYLLLGLCLALFYPTLTFVSGLVGLAPAALLSVLAFSGLVIVFLGLTVGWKQSLWSSILLLFIFLGVFSLGMFTPWRGLVLTAGAASLVAIFMLAYARRPPDPLEEPGVEVEAETVEEESIPEGEGHIPPIEAEAPEPVEEPVGRYCPRCGRQLAADHAFCPGCGYDTHVILHCAHCGHHQLLQADIEPAYCLHCGEVFD